MCVADRVMDGDVRALYKADNAVVGRQVVDSPSDLPAIQAKDTDEAPAEIGWSQQPKSVEIAMKRRLQWNNLMDILEHERLHKALIRKVTRL
ncbi:expressed unknown protein [Seminavis robusta]|uniref:Uncharacterized protein n=1 Tax=Seminavis robusta TaxID=568900 RepID=A0A9N8EY92_9STRA|nr:expressed unknown protein [Seminavis robusta]|eukprot:Sro2160_g317072.1  (92) ;mRNA; f:17080-17355